MLKSAMPWGVRLSLFQQRAEGEKAARSFAAETLYHHCPWREGSRWRFPAESQLGRGATFSS